MHKIETNIITEFAAYQRFTLADCKDKEFRKFGFVAKTQIL